MKVSESFVEGCIVIAFRTQKATKANHLKMNAVESSQTFKLLNRTKDYCKTIVTSLAAMESDGTHLHQLTCFIYPQSKATNQLAQIDTDC